ncbi:MlaE family ABC transporter permease [Desulfonatronum lacustre]|uniref:MlaE family ABC transporter permease n=1 Tax=Desulfonatronum lacustre TaxID=66849 RepID=UPI00048F5543|nr:ABC transporter permease [Desulfonatronum lacustre]SMP68398.1 phospholipid/cholesterol/gamma-HCH transport system permease protein [Desulfonatronum zhilinae]
MSLPLVQTLGRWAIDRSQSYTRMARILGQTGSAFARLSFFNPAVFFVLVRQVYFTAVQPLTIIIVAALILGSVTVHILLRILLSLGAYEQIGAYLVTAMLHYIAPITCTLIIVLRSGTAVLTEVALMKINREIATLDALAVPVAEYLYLPRLTAFLIAGPCLSFCFCIVGLFGGFFTLGFLHDITFASYLDRLLEAVHVFDVLTMIAKSTIMAGLVCLVALQRGLSVQRSFTEVPIRLIQGMIQTVTLIIAVEVLFNLF